MFNFSFNLKITLPCFCLLSSKRQCTYSKSHGVCCVTMIQLLPPVITWEYYRQPNKLIHKLAMQFNCYVCWMFQYWVPLSLSVMYLSKQGVACQWVVGLHETWMKISVSYGASKRPKEYITVKYTASVVLIWGEGGTNYSICQSIIGNSIILSLAAIWLMPCSARNFTARYF
jgi:hypothetical protein